MAATENYNEVTHAAGSSPSSKDYSCLDPLYKWDTRFPERITCLQDPEEIRLTPGQERRSGRRLRNRQSARFKTQPITFDEIKEVDEDGAEDAIAALKDQFTAFSRSMDGLLPAKCQNPASQDSASGREDGASAAAAPGPSAAMLAGMAQHERSRSRRLKRRSKRGIQTVPELEKEPGETQAG